MVLNLNHSNQVQHILGRCRNGKGTLTLAKRGDCIESECELPETTAANDTLVLIQRGDITGMSFAFNDDWEDTENGVSYERTSETVDGKEVWLRHVKRITGLYDVSIVTTPAYEQTTVGTREAGDDMLKRIDEQIVAQDTAKAEEQRKAEEAERQQREAEEQRQREEAERQAAREAEEVAGRNRRRSRRNTEEMFETLIY